MLDKSGRQIIIYPMEWLITAGAISLLAGILLLFAGEIVGKIGDIFNRPIAYIDNTLIAVRIPVGIALTVIGGWIISVAFYYPVLWYLYVIGAIILFFGLLYLFSVRWLKALSSSANMFLFSADTLISETRKSFGLILIIVAIYIFYAAFLAMK